MFSKLLLLFILIYLTSSQLQAKIVTKQSPTCFNKIAGNNDEFLSNRKIFIDLYNLFLNNDIESIKLFQDTISKNKILAKYIELYFSSLSNVYIALLNMTNNDKDEAQVYMNKAKNLIASSLELNDKFNESLRLASDIYGISIALNPFLAPFYGSISDSYALKSHAINPNNPLLILSFAESFYHTPFVFGGDKDKAKEMFDNAYTTCPLYEDTAYRVLAYDTREGKVNKKTCNLYAKYKYLINIKRMQETIIKVEKKCKNIK